MYVMVRLPVRLEDHCMEIQVTSDRGGGPADKRTHSNSIWALVQRVKVAQPLPLADWDHKIDAMNLKASDQERDKKLQNNNKRC